MRISFVRGRAVSYGISLTLAALSVAAYFFLPLRLGIDMTGGTVSEFTYEASVPAMDGVLSMAKEAAAEADKAAGKTVVGDVMAYPIAGEARFKVEAGFDGAGVDVAKLDAAKTAFKDGLSTRLASLNSSKVTLVSYVNISESLGAYIRNSAYLTLVLVVVVISAYIAWAFRGSVEGLSSASFAAATTVSLIHDVVIAFGLYVATSYFLPQFKIDTFFVTAMLTVLGYSINDTIVVLDRVRSTVKLAENRRRNLGDIINDAINDTLVRSLFTSLTVVLVLVVMLAAGPETIKGFTLAMTFGVVVGTYSSVAIAAPILYDLNARK